FIALTPPPPPTSTPFPYTTLFRSAATVILRENPTELHENVPQRAARQGARLTFTKHFLDLRSGPKLGPREGRDVLDTVLAEPAQDRKSTRLNSSHVKISYAVFCLK